MKLIMRDKCPLCEVSKSELTEQTQRMLNLRQDWLEAREEIASQKKHYESICDQMADARREEQLMRHEAQDLVKKLRAALTAIKDNALSYKPSAADIVDICEEALK